MPVQYFCLCSFSGLIPNCHYREAARARPFTDLPFRIETLSVIDDSVPVIVQAALLDGRCQFEVALCGCLPGLAAIFTDNEADEREVAALLRVDGSDIAVAGAGIIEGCHHVLPAIRSSHSVTSQIKFLQTDGGSPRNFDSLGVRRLRECMCLIIFASRVTYHGMFTPLFL